MKSLLSFIVLAIAVAIILMTGRMASGLQGLERTIVEVSGGIIAGVMFLIFLILSALVNLKGPERCNECGRPIDPRLAYGEEPNTANPPCRECGRPLPASQWNS